jgi:hypothetical protein
MVVLGVGDFTEADLVDVLQPCRPEAGLRMFGACSTLRPRIRPQPELSLRAEPRIVLHRPRGFLVADPAR